MVYNNQTNYGMTNGCTDMTSRRFTNQIPDYNNTFSRRQQTMPFNFQQQPLNIQPPPMQRYNVQPPPMQQQGGYQQPSPCVDWRVLEQQRQSQNNQCVGSSKPWNERQPIVNWDYIRNHGWGEPQVQQNSDGVVAMFYDPQGRPLFGPAVL